MPLTDSSLFDHPAAIVPALTLEAAPGALAIEGSAAFEVKRIDWFEYDNEILLVA